MSYPLMMIELRIFIKDYASSYWEFHNKKKDLNTNIDFSGQIEKELKEIDSPGILPHRKSGYSHRPKEKLIQMEKELLKELNSSHGYMLTKDRYITSILETVFNGYWPYPESDFFCRCCNYQEFTSTVELNKHFLSPEHKLMEGNYLEAFCLSCQVHNLNSFGMRWHCQTEYHQKTSKLMKENEDLAKQVWERVKTLRGKTSDQPKSRECSQPSAESDLLKNLKGIPMWY